MAQTTRGRASNSRAPNWWLRRGRCIIGAVLPSPSAPRLCLALIAALGCATTAAAAPQVGYAQATGYYKAETRPTLYPPLNLLDGREATVWCTRGPDQLEDQLTFGFKGPAEVDEVRIYTGNGADDSTFAEFARARKFTFRGPNNAYSFTVSDQRGLQAIAVNPPLVGSFLAVEIEEQYPSEDPEAPVCVTDIVFYSNGKALNGPWMTQRLKYDKHRAPLLGTWFGGYEGAPDRFLSFFFDGTFRLTYEPFEGRPRALTGNYRVSGSRVTLELPGKARVTGRVEVSRTEEDPLTPASERRELRFEGAVHEDLKQTFRDVK